MTRTRARRHAEFLQRCRARVLQELGGKKFLFWLLAFVQRDNLHKLFSLVGLTPFRLDPRPVFKPLRCLAALRDPSIDRKPTRRSLAQMKAFSPQRMASFEGTSMTSPGWRALGKIVLVYFAACAAAATAQDTQPGRATFAEMIAFARLASVPCQRLAPDADSFRALALRRLINHLSPRRRSPQNKKT